jgi:hypothetical protein
VRTDTRVPAGIFAVPQNGFVDERRLVSRELKLSDL